MVWSAGSISKDSGLKSTVQPRFLTLWSGTTPPLEISQMPDSEWCLHWGAGPHSCCVNYEISIDWNGQLVIAIQGRNFSFFFLPFVPLCRWSSADDPFPRPAFLYRRTADRTLATLSTSDPVPWRSAFRPFSQMPLRRYLIRIKDPPAFPGPVWKRISSSSRGIRVRSGWTSQ